MQDFVLINGRRNSHESNKGNGENEIDMLRPSLYYFLITTKRYSLPFYTK